MNKYLFTFARHWRSDVVPNRLLCVCSRHPRAATTRVVPICVKEDSLVKWPRTTELPVILPRWAMLGAVIRHSSKSWCSVILINSVSMPSYRPSRLVTFPAMAYLWRVISRHRVSSHSSYHVLCVRRCGRCTLPGHPAILAISLVNKMLPCWGTWPRSAFKSST